MNRSVNFLLLSCCVLLVFNSCRVEKRIHRPGYHVEWKKSKSNKEQQQRKDTEESHTEFAQKNPVKEGKAVELIADVGATSDRTGNPEWFLLMETKYEHQKDKQYDIVKYFDDECDTLYMRDGRVILAVVTEINPMYIKYKRCDYQTGPMITVNKNDVDRVVYPNGIVEEFEEVINPRSSAQHSSSSAQPHPQESEKREINSLAAFSTFAGLLGFIFSGLISDPRPTIAIILGGLAFVTSLSGMIMIGTNDNYSGLGLAILGMLFSILIMFFLLLPYA